jgi:hypothetical protein
MFEGSATEIDGFKIPYDGTLFLVVLGIHVIAGLTCVVTGAWAMLSKKRRGAHSKAGTVYFRGMAVLFLTAALIAIARWKEDYHLFLLGAVAFAAAGIARSAVRRKWKTWSIYHITGMGISYIVMLIAFYVDNGKFLPVWKNLPPMLYWLLPVIIGTPLLVRALWTSPFSRNYFRKSREQ